MIESCPICGGVPGNSSNIPDRFFGLPGTFRVSKCAACRAAWVADPPADLDPFYPATYYERHTPGGARVPKVRLRSPRLRRWFPRFWDIDADNLVCGPGSILEVGCGSGAGLDRYRQAGWSTTGLEPSRQGAELARARGHSVIERPIDAPDVSFEAEYDVVRCRHVIEHVSDPIAVVTKLTSAVRPGGKLLLEFPNVLGLNARTSGFSWWQLDPPRHLVIPPFPAVVSLLQDSNFTVVAATKTSGAGLASSAKILLSRYSRKPQLLSDERSAAFGVSARALEPLALLADLCRAGDDIRLIATKADNRRHRDGHTRAQS